VETNEFYYGKVGSFFLPLSNSLFSLTNSFSLIIPSCFSFPHANTATRDKHRVCEALFSHNVFSVIVF
jgi:hypothetical protein